MAPISYENNNEKGALKQFREDANDLFDSRPTDEYLLRFLRARNLDKDKALVMLKNCLQWRKDIDVKGLLNWTPPPMITNDFVYKFTGFDEEGRPVLVVPFGAWNVRDMIEKGEKEDAFKTVHRLLETIMVNIDASKSDQFVVILDSNFLTFRKVAHIETIDSVVKFFKDFEAYYPETLKSCYIINAPWVFEYIFAFVKPLLSAHTLSKVTIFGGENKWKPILMKEIPSNSLPECYGGTAENLS